MTDKQKNLIVRSITGVLFIAVLVGGMLYSDISFTILFAIISGLTMWEYCNVVEGYHGVSLAKFINTSGAVILFVSANFYASMGYAASMKLFAPYLVVVIYLLVSELYRKRQAPLLNIAFTLMGQVYVAVPYALLSSLVYKADDAYTSGMSFSGWLPLCIFILLWTNDTGAYCFGSTFGRNKLFPSVSPAKSWEGSVGGGFMALGVSLILAHFDPTMTRPEWLGFAMVVVVFGTWGDLLDSLLKRQIGIKDSGNILPGHGGMLDRFDSSLLAVPAVCAYLALLF